MCRPVAIFAAAMDAGWHVASTAGCTSVAGAKTASYTSVAGGQ